MSVQLVLPLFFTYCLVIYRCGREGRGWRLGDGGDNEGVNNDGGDADSDGGNGARVMVVMTMVLGVLVIITMMRNSREMMAMMMARIRGRRRKRNRKHTCFSDNNIASSNDNDSELR